MLSNVEREVTVYCPACGALETLVVVDGSIAPSSHWRLVGGALRHHNCGRNCRVFGSQQISL